MAAATAAAAAAAAAMAVVVVVVVVVVVALVVVVAVVVEVAVVMVESTEILRGCPHLDGELIGFAPSHGEAAMVCRNSKTFWPTVNSASPRGIKTLLPQARVKLNNR